MDGLHVRELQNIFRVAPLRKPARGVQVCLADVVVTNVGGKEFDGTLRRLGSRSSSRVRAKSEAEEGISSAENPVQTS